MTPKQVAGFAIGPLSGAAIGLITVPIISWLFSQEDVGRLAMLQVALSFSVLLFSLGLDQAYVREYFEVDDKPALLKSVWLPGFLILIIVLTSTVLWPKSLPFLFFGVESSFLAIAIVIAILSTFCSRFMGLVLRMQGKALRYSFSQLLPKLVFLAVIVSYFFGGVEASFDRLIAASFASLAVTFFVLIWSVRSELKHAVRAPVDKQKQLAMIKYALPLIASGVAYWGLTSVDKLFLRELSSFSELGLYSVANSFAAVGLVFQAVFSVIWAPQLYKWVSEGVGIDKIKSVMDYLSLVVVLIWCGVGLFSWVVPFLLPAEYQSVQLLLLAGMGYPLFYTLAECTGAGIGIMRKTQFAMLATLVALFVNVVGNWWLIPKFGASGASVSSVIAFYVFFVIRTEASVRLWRNFERWRLYIVVSLLSLGALIFNLVHINVWVVVITYLLIAFVGVFLFRREANKGVKRMLAGADASV